MSLATSSVIFPRCPFSAVNSRYSSRLYPATRLTPRPAPAASARHGAAGSTSPSTTGENDTPVRPAGPHRSWWSAGFTASEAAVSRAGSAAANASVVGGSPASAATAAVTSAASSGEKNVPGTLCAIARRNRPAARGMTSSDAIAPAPDDSPNTVTWSGSPPNAAMFSWTQRSAATWSSSPRLAGTPGR